MISGTEIKTIPVIRTPRDMQEWSRAKRKEGRTIGCAPTMGALHEGHLSLIRRSASECDETIVTIFVNPTQFAPGEDLEKYPRNEESDLILAGEAGATIAYCPSAEVMYTPDASTWVIEDNMTGIMCGESRPTHFRGVTTVVAKLFNACLPDRAYFGQKDYQQLLVIKRMVSDLDFPVEIVSCPIVRERDGLAMSSRNKYLSADERSDAVILKNALDAACDAVNKGERNPRELERIARTLIETVRTSGIDYVEVRDAEDLSVVDEIDRPVVLALAVLFGETRLIDNVIIYPAKESM